jgi:hypothetical protein
MPTVFLGFHVQSVDRASVELPEAGTLSANDLRRVENAVKDALDF